MGSKRVKRPVSLIPRFSAVFIGVWDLQPLQRFFCGVVWEPLRSLNPRPLPREKQKYSSAQIRLPFVPSFDSRPLVLVANSGICFHQAVTQRSRMKGKVQNENTTIRSR